MSPLGAAGLQIGLAILASGLVTAQIPRPFSHTGAVIRDSPALDAIIAPGASIEVLASGFGWTEGPVWVKRGGYLLFSDIPGNSVMKWTEVAGVTLFLKPSGYTGHPRPEGVQGSNGLAIDPSGQLVLCEHGDRRISVLQSGGHKRTLVDKYKGKRLNSPNDVVFRSNGDLYFTDPPYGLPLGEKDRGRELPYSGVFRLSPNGALTLLTSELTFPNGIAFSPDEKLLYVSQSDPARAIWMSYPLKPDGTLGQGRVFFDATALVSKRSGLPDGLKVDRFGNLFATGPGGVHVFSPGGKHLGRIDTGEKTSNCAWGDDGSTLYVTSDMLLCRIRTLTKGAGWK
jgi:gluconolactonase